MIDISICMVALNCRHVLSDCLASITEHSVKHTIEIIVVDNNSNDDSVKFIEQYYPRIKLICNERNVGFSAATNQAIEKSCGQFILWLNTDTVLLPGTLDRLVDFLNEHPKVGIVGPKVLNSDGTFQAQCKRGIPTPLAAFCKTFGLHRIWPNNRIAGQYFLSYLPKDHSNKVDSVSGCCLMARRQVWRDIGPLDDEIFGFGEDIDWCIRAKKRGWEVWYFPESVIFHLKGQGGAQSKPHLKSWGIHQAMWIIYRKHLKSKYPWFVTGLVFLGIGVSLTFSMGIAIIKLLGVKILK